MLARIGLIGCYNNIWCSWSRCLSDC